MKTWMGFEMWTVEAQATETRSSPARRRSMSSANVWRRRPLLWLKNERRDVIWRQIKLLLFTQQPRVRFSTFPKIYNNVAVIY